MYKPKGKKVKNLKVEKEDSKQDLIFANYLVEDFTAYEALLPSDENAPLSKEQILEIIEAVKKIKARSETFSTAFRAKYDSVRFNKVQSVCKAFLRSGADNPRFRYQFLLKEFTASRKELYKNLPQ